MARSSGRGSRRSSGRRPGALILSQGSVDSLARVTGLSPEDARLLRFAAVEAHEGRDAMTTYGRAQTRVVEALDATLVRPIKLSDDTIVEKVYVDHSRRLEAAAVVLSQVDPNPATRGPGGGNILLQVVMADGSRVQVGATSIQAPDKPEPRVVGPGLGGGGS